MVQEKVGISNQLFFNRKIFLRYNQFKLDRINEILSFTDRRIFTLIPRLLHTHQEGLPGYLPGKVPQGVHSFTVNHECQFTGEELFPETIIRRQEYVKPFIESIMLMGSVGSVAHTQKSDLDYTLLVRKKTVSPQELDLFTQKLRLIENWVWDNYKLEIHFFVNDIEEVQQNIFGESDSESTGSALAKLLKEEMFRTLVVVAGKIPFWWIVPLETDDEQYDNYFNRVKSYQTLLNPDDFVDIGNVDDISPEEFFGGSIWALIKSFKSPFKTLMKMGLLEEYMFRETRSNLLCHEIKKKVFGKIPFPEIDPYLNLFHRVDEFFKESKTDNEVEALRTAFYIKVGTQVHGEDLEAKSLDQKKQVLVTLIKDWGWTSFKLNNLNSYSQWQIMQKVSLGNWINKILMSSYKLISEKNKSLGQDRALISARDTHLLGRKLFSFFRTSPNKVESLFALVDGESGEKALTFLYDKNSSLDKGKWYLVRGKTRDFLEQIPAENIIKKAATLQFLTAFTCFNHLYRPDTKLLLKSERHESIKEGELRQILEELSNYLAQVNVANIPNDDLLRAAEITQLFIMVDFGNPVPVEVLKGNIQNCQTPEEHAEFINHRLQRIRGITTIYLTSWGELFCKTYSGLNCLDRALYELSPQINRKKIQEENYFKVFVPGSRRISLNFSWLFSYIIQAALEAGQPAGTPETAV